MAGQHSGVWWQCGLMLAMALMCLPCVLPLWRAGSPGAARMLMGGALFMVAAHTALLLTPGGTGAGTGTGHQHGAGAVLISAAAGSVSAAAPSAGAAGSPFGMLSLIGWELAVAMLAATWLRRRALSAAWMLPGVASPQVPTL